MSVIAKSMAPSRNTLHMASRDMSGSSRDSESRASDLMADLWATQNIVSESNGKIKLLKSLHMKKKREGENLILLEGHRQVIDALKCSDQGQGNWGECRPKYLLLTRRALEAPLGMVLLETLIKSGNDNIEIDLVEESTMRKVLSDVDSPQGVIAAFHRPKFISAKDNTLSGSIAIDQIQSKKAPLVVLLDRISDPGNLGTIIRTSYGFGVDSMITVDGTCDAWSPKSIRSAMGLCLKLPILETNWKELTNIFLSNDIFRSILPGSREVVSDDHEQHVQILLADYDESAVPYHTVDLTKPTIVVIGSEAFGISEEAQSLLSRFPNKAKKVMIPMSKGRDLESLNAAVAASVILSEVARQRDNLDNL